MTKLLTIILLVISFVLFVQSYKLSNDMDSWSELFQEMNMMGDKKARYEHTVYPLPPDVKTNIMSKIGQVGGLDTLANGNLLIFHRGERTWTFNSFWGNKFNTEAYGPIEQNTLTLIDWKNLNEIGSWGNKKFYMPHGLTVDFEGKIWVTDVGLHQVFKFDSSNMDKPELVLGEAFGHGNDDAHFCKPTDVVVAKSNGHIFVSDGYCNRRVVEFDKNGKFVKSIEDTEKPMTVVHSITMIDSLGLVCTVSREEGRIVCFDVITGEKKKEITHPKMITVYGIRYDAANEVLHAATGDNHGRANSTGLTFDASESRFGKFLDEWKAGNRDLSRVHDLTTTPDGSRIFLGQLNSEVDMFSFQ